jgi:hypothetical protein
MTETKHERKEWKLRRHGNEDDETKVEVIRKEVRNVGQETKEK